MDTKALLDLTKLAELSREAFALGLRLQALAEGVEGTIDRLGEQAGVTVEDVYRPLYEDGISAGDA